MQELLTDAINRLGTREYLIIPLVLTLWIAWGDVKTRRIPNYLTLSGAVSGLSYGVIVNGWSGLAASVGGMGLGFGLLILPYVWGGMGAGDVKALAALGAWLGPKATLYLFCYMGIAGGLFALGVLCWKGLLWQNLRQGGSWLLNFILCKTAGVKGPAPPAQKTEGIPYGVAIAVGMIALLGIGV